jgi:hypothetical protein
LVYVLIPLGSILLEKLTTSQLVNKFPTFYATREVIAVCTSPHWSSPSQINPVLILLHIRSVIILSFRSHLALPKQVFASDFPSKILNRPRRIRWAGRVARMGKNIS